MRATPYITLIVLAGTLLLGTSGCAPGPAPAGVSGSVSFNGQPVEEGTLRFFPTGEEMGHGLGANIVAGRYEISADQGLFAGPYTVALTAVKPTGRQIPRREVDPGESPMVAETVQYLPERYTTPGEVTLALTPGDNTHDFSLTP